MLTFSFEKSTMFLRQFSEMPNRTAQASQFRNETECHRSADCHIRSSCRVQDKSVSENHIRAGVTRDAQEARYPVPSQAEFVNYWIRKWWSGNRLGNKTKFHLEHELIWTFWSIVFVTYLRSLLCIAGGPRKKVSGVLQPLSAAKKQLHHVHMYSPVQNESGRSRTDPNWRSGNSKS